jgi:hypothetical protein
MFEQTPSFGNAEMLAEKWSPVLDHSDLPGIRDTYRRSVTAVLLENQEKALMEAIPANGLGSAGALSSDSSYNGLAGFDPILISLVRRSMPNIVAYDIAGVQPMTGPTGLVFALRSNYIARNGAEALFNEPLVSFTGTGGNPYGGSTAAQGSDPLLGTTETGNTGLTNAYGLNRTLAEDLGTAPAFNTMAFTIDKTSVVAKTRALKAEYTTELAQDLKAIHGLDAETELANILSTEILAEINREVLRNVYRTAKLGAQQADLYHKGATSAAGLSAGNSVGGVYDLLRDSDGRWSAERFRGLMFQIEREANTIAKETRRGKGNFLVCSADVASALAMGGFLQLSPGTNVNLEVDDTGNLFAGTLNGKMKVYIDPYMGPGNGTTSYDFACVGYKGTSPYDAGIFYCPYVPLQMVRAINETTFQPKIGFKTRYGMVSNPWVAVKSDGSWDANRTDPSSNDAIRVNQYYRIFRVANLHGLNAASATG